MKRVLIKKSANIISGVIVAICIALLFGEILIRIFFPQPQAMQWLHPNEKYGYTLKKNYYERYVYPRSGAVMEVKTNSLGLRDKEYDLSSFSDSSVKKILLLGDSFTFGHGVNIEDTFDSRLEALLNRHGKFIVLNGGVGGWGTLQEIAYAKDNFNLFNPDIIVLTFCGNDPGDDHR